MSDEIDEEPAHVESTDDPTEYDFAIDKHGWVLHRDWNVVEGFLGAPGTGKTDRMVRRALELQKLWHCYLIAHDIGWKIPPTLHDGTPTGLQKHRNVSECIAALRTHPSGVHAISSANALPVLGLARQLGEASLARGKGYGPPVLVLIDETVQSQIADRKYLNPDMRELICDRRHAHVGLLWSVQSIRFVNAGLVTLSPIVWCSRIREEYSLDTLAKSGVPDEDLAKLPSLGQHEFLAVRTGG